MEWWVLRKADRTIVGGVNAPKVKRLPEPPEGMAYVEATPERKAAFDAAEQVVFQAEELGFHEPRQIAVDDRGSVSLR